MIQFRKATHSDAEEIASLVNSAYRGDSSKQGWTTEAELLDGLRTDAEHVRAMIDEKDGQIELAFDEQGRLMGCVNLKKLDADTLYFGMLTVQPGLQTQGLGKIMIEHVDQTARGWGCSRVKITVIHLRAELIAYYERRGFKATGAFEKFPEDDVVFGIPKVKGLKLLEFIKELQ